MPGQVTPAQRLGGDCPHATVLTAGHIGLHTHTPPEHVCPDGHIVPVPHDGPPGQTLAMVVPHATVEGLVVGQRLVHTQVPPVHV